MKKYRLQLYQFIYPIKIKNIDNRNIKKPYL